MATTKISALPAATTAAAADLTIAVNASSDEKATVTQIATYSRALTGATTASAITGSGSSLIINTALADSDTRIAGTTSANLFFVDAGLDKVGIATAVPTQKLDVTGTVNATLFAGSGASLTGLGTTSTAFRTVATDPSPLVNGDVWYNSTSDAFKCAQALDVFASSAALLATFSRGGSAGTISALTLTGGVVGGTAALTQMLWNGTAWSSGVSSAVIRYESGGCGTSTASLLTCEQLTGVSPNSEKFNGTSWSTTGSQILTIRSFGVVFGTDSSALVATGYSSAGNTYTCEKFNGSTWSSTTVYPSGASKGGEGNSGIGTSSNAGMSTGDYDSTSMYSWDGTTWGAIGSRISGYGWSLGTGTVTSAIAMGGTSGGASAATTETYNGSVWAAGSALGTARKMSGGAGPSSSSALIAGGMNSATSYSTTEILSSTVAAKTFTVA